jgi:cytochrome c551/c552
MKQTLAVAVALTLLGGAVAHPAAQQQAGPGAPLPVAQQNALVQKRCVICHTDATPLGGLSLQHFDAAQPDPDVARIMRVKIVEDGAISAAGQPVPDRVTTALLVEALAAASRSGPATKWRVELEADPLVPNTGHALVTARADEGGVVFSCNGKTRRPRLQATGTTVSPSAVDFEGLSPTIRQIFSWCLGVATSSKYLPHHGRSTRPTPVSTPWSCSATRGARSPRGQAPHPAIPRNTGHARDRCRRRSQSST